MNAINWLSGVVCQKECHFFWWISADFWRFFISFDSLLSSFWWVRWQECDEKSKEWRGVAVHIGILGGLDASDSWG
ncbi:MAG: hypothetical protein HQM00_17370 [Magnetococcales bacterium]|nr:hypothetical protein [Magnetococcales bacterium]